MPDILVRKMNSRTKRLGALKPLAIQLRMQGKTFSEIQKELGFINKGTLSGWVKNIELTDEQKQRIRLLMTEKGLVGRQIGAWKNHEKRINRLARIKVEATDEYPLLCKDPFFLTGLVLYLAEGSKKSESFQFMNSDPFLIKIMIRWILQVTNLSFSNLRFRLYIHEIYAHENCELFWLESLNAKPEQLMKTIYKPTEREYKKNPSYKGCLRIESPSGSELYWRTLTWRDCLYATIS